MNVSSRIDIDKFGHERELGVVKHIDDETSSQMLATACDCGDVGSDDGGLKVLLLMGLQCRPSQGTGKTWAAQDLTARSVSAPFPETLHVGLCELSERAYGRAVSRFCGSCWMCVVQLVCASTGC